MWKLLVPSLFLASHACAGMSEDVYLTYASFRTVAFQKNNARPYVAIEVDSGKIIAELYRLKNLSATKDKLNDRDNWTGRRFQPRGARKSGSPENLILDTQRFSGKLYLLLKKKASYNGRYVVEVHLTGNASVTVIHGTKASGDHPAARLPVALGDRWNAAVETNLERKERAMVTAILDGGGNFIPDGNDFQRERRSAIHGILRLSSKAVTNPLQHWIVNEFSYYELSLNARVSTRQLDKSTSIILSLRGVTDLGFVAGLTTISALDIRSTQSLSNASTTYFLGFRAGDARHNVPRSKRKENPEFVLLADAINPVYAEFGLEVGYNYSSHFVNVPRNTLEGFILRPVVALGFNNATIRGSQIHLSGIAKVYYLDRNLGRAFLDNRFGETIEMSLRYGESRNGLTFSITAGRNPVEGFTRITTELRLSFSRAF